MKQYKLEDDKVVITYHVVNNEVICSGRVKEPVLDFGEQYRIKHALRDITLDFTPINRSKFSIKTHDLTLDYLALVTWFCGDWVKGISIDSANQCIVVDGGDNFIATDEQYTENMFDFLAGEIFDEQDYAFDCTTWSYVLSKLDSIKSMDVDDAALSIELINNVLQNPWRK